MVVNYNINGVLGQEVVTAIGAVVTAATGVKIF